MEYDVTKLKAVADGAQNRHENNEKCCADGSGGGHVGWRRGEAEGSLRYLCRCGRYLRGCAQHDARAVRFVQRTVVSGAAAVGWEDAEHRGRAAERRGW